MPGSSRQLLIFSRAVVNSLAIEMEIFFEEISSFLTRFGNLRHSAWSRQWSHNLKVRFHETWSLKTSANVFGS